MARFFMSPVDPLQRELRAARRGSRTAELHLAVTENELHATDALARNLRNEQREEADYVDYLRVRLQEELTNGQEAADTIAHQAAAMQDFQLQIHTLEVLLKSVNESYDLESKSHCSLKLAHAQLLEKHEKLRLEHGNLEGRFNDLSRSTTNIPTLDSRSSSPEPDAYASPAYRPTSPSYSPSYMPTSPSYRANTINELPQLEVQDDREAFVDAATMLANVKYERQYEGHFASSGHNTDVEETDYEDDTMMAAMDILVKREIERAEKHAAKKLKLQEEVIVID